MSEQKFLDKEKSLQIARPKTSEGDVQIPKTIGPDKSLGSGRASLKQTIQELRRKASEAKGREIPEGISNQYEILDKVEFRDVLDSNRELEEILKELPDRVDEYFEYERLQIATEARNSVIPRDILVKVRVITEMDTGEALDKLDEFTEEEWLEMKSGMDDKIMLNIFWV